MKTFTNPKELNANINEFTYEGCRYDGIPSGTTFSVLSEGLAEYLTETFPFLVESTTPAPVASNEFCCTKCNKDCGSKFMKERHEKVCKAKPRGLATILKPNYIFWNYPHLDRSQLTPDQLIPESAALSKPNTVVINESDVTNPAPGREGTALIGRKMEKVVTDRDGIDWYGPGLEDDHI